MPWFIYTVTLYFKVSRDSSVGITTGWTGIKRPRREADHLPACTAEVKNAVAIPPLPSMSSWHNA
jgi:hypothetical protein